MDRKWFFFLGFLLLAVAADYATKYWAANNLDYGVTEEAWGGILKLTLSYNRGAAFGISLGSASRPLFIVFSIVTFLWLLTVFHRTAGNERARILGIALVCSGAVGNLIDRLKGSEGVVDFLGPYDLKFMLWPIFNVADIYVVIGIVLLFWSLRSGGLHEESRSASSGAAAGASPGSGASSENTALAEDGKGTL